MLHLVNEGEVLVGADSRKCLTVPVAALISYNENKRIDNQESTDVQKISLIVLAFLRLARSARCGILR